MGNNDLLKKIHGDIEQNYPTKENLYEETKVVIPRVINILMRFQSNEKEIKCFKRSQIMARLHILYPKDNYDKMPAPHFRKLIQIYRERAFEDYFFLDSFKIENGLFKVRSCVGIIIAKPTGYRFTEDWKDIQEYQAALTQRRTSLSKQDLAMEIVIDKIIMKKGKKK